MATIHIFTSEAPKIGPLEFDVIFQDTLESTVELALYPLEIGADAADHRIILPKMYSLTGAVSNTPLTIGLETLESIGVEALSSLFSSSIASEVAGLAAGFLAGSDDTRASATLSMLLAIQASGEPFDLTTGYINLSNMTILSIRSTRTPRTEGGFTFTADLQEMPRVETVLRQNTPTNDQLRDGDPSGTQASPVANQGEVSTSLLTNPTLLADITEFFV